jgi:hypothetical protein
VGKSEEVRTDLVIDRAGLDYQTVMFAEVAAIVETAGLDNTPRRAAHSQGVVNSSVSEGASNGLLCLALVFVPLACLVCLVDSYIHPVGRGNGGGDLCCLVSAKDVALRLNVCARSAVERARLVVGLPLLPLFAGVRACFC